MTSKKKTTMILLNEKGFTLIEFLITIVILGIIAMIAVPGVVELLEKAKAEVCIANRLELRNNYSTYIQLEGIPDSLVVFNEYFNDYEVEICPDHGVVIYKDGKVLCSIHSGGENEYGDVPFL